MPVHQGGRALSLKADALRYAAIHTNDSWKSAASLVQAHMVVAVGVVLAQSLEPKICRDQLLRDTPHIWNRIVWTVAPHPSVRPPEKDLAGAGKGGVRIVLQYILNLTQNPEGEKIAVLYVEKTAGH